MYTTILISKVRQTCTPPKLCKKTAEATGFSECTVNYVLLQKRKLDGSSFASPNKRYKESKGKQRKVMVKGHIKEHKKFTCLL